MVTLPELYDALLKRNIVYRYRPEQLEELEARNLGLGSQPPRRSVNTRYGPMVEEVIPPTLEPAFVSLADWSRADRLCQAWDSFFRLAFQWYVTGRTGSDGNGCFSLIGTGLERERCVIDPGYPSLLPFVRFDCVERLDGSLVVLDVNSSRPIGAAHTEALGRLFNELGLVEAEPPPFSRAIADHLIECYAAWCVSNHRNIEQPNLAIVIPEHLGSVPDFEVLRQFLLPDKRFASVELVDPNDLRCSSAPKRLERNTAEGWQPVDLVLRTIKPDLDPSIAPALVEAYPDAACVTSPLYRRWLGSKFWFYLAQREPYRSAITEGLGPELSAAFFDSLPETGLFESGTVTFTNGRQPIERLNHKDWVVKVAGGSSARGIIIGRSSSRARWQQAMLDLYDSRLIIQRFIPPRRFRFTYLGAGNEPRSDVFLTKLGLYSFGGRSVGYELNGCPNSYKIHGGRGSVFTPVYILPNQREQETHGIWVPGSSHSPTEE